MLMSAKCAQAITSLRDAWSITTNSSEQISARDPGFRARCDAISQDHNTMAVVVRFVPYSQAAIIAPSAFRRPPLTLTLLLNCLYDAGELYPSSPLVPVTRRRSLEQCSSILAMGSADLLCLVLDSLRIQTLASTSTYR